MATDKIQTKKIIEALKRWSPHGLCSGRLVRKNGNPLKTEACTVGAMTLDFLKSPEGRKFVRSKGFKTKELLKDVLYNRQTLTSTGTMDAMELRDAMYEYYGIDDGVAGAMMSYNDRCLETAGEARKDEESAPTAVRKVIYSLRKRFAKYAEAWEKKQREKNPNEFFSYPGK